MLHLSAAFSIVLAAGLAAAPSQPDPSTVSPSAPSRQIPSIPDALAQVHKTYREAPLADRVVLRVTAADGKEKRVQIMVYTDRGAPEPAADAPPNTPKARAAQFRADLGQLHIHIKDRSLTALNLFERTTYFRTMCSEAIDAALARNFPPIPLPQVQLCFAPDETLTSPTPLTTPVSWTSIEATTDVGRSLLTLKGNSPAGPVTLSFDRQTGRVRRFIAEFPGARGAAVAKFDLTSSPADAGDSRNWLLPVDGRTRVESPALLVPPRAGIAAGSSVKHASLMTDALAPLTPESLFAAGVQTVVLVTVRADGFREGAPHPDLDAALAAAAAVVNPGKVLVRPVVLLGKNELDPAKIDEVVATLRTAMERSDLREAPLVTASEVLGIERGGQPVDVALIAVAPDLKARGVVVADGRSEDAKALAAEAVSITTAPATAESPTPTPTLTPNTPNPAPTKSTPDGPKEPSGGK